MTRITVVHQAALGDTILLLPLIGSLRQRFGSASVTLVTRTNLGQMLTLLGLIEAYASADDREHTLWFAPPTGPKPNSLPPWADADLLISAVTGTAGADDSWSANARLARPHRPANTLLFFHPRPPLDFPGHVTAWHRRQLAELQLLEAPLPLLRVNPDGPVVIHPGSGGDAKCWPRERFLHLGRDLQRNGILPTFILGEVEQDRWEKPEILALQNDFPTYFHMGLYELADKLSRARLFLGNDSGVTHLAAALGIPTIALFGPSDDTHWRPIGPAVKILHPPAPDPADLQSLPEFTVLHELLATLRQT